MELLLTAMGLQHPDVLADYLLAALAADLHRHLLDAGTASGTTRAARIGS